MLDISKKINLLLEIVGKKPADIARETGIPPSRISEIITGSNKNPKIETLQRIVSAAGGEICFFPADSKTRPPPLEVPTSNEGLPGWLTVELSRLVEAWHAADPVIKKAALRMLEESAKELREKERQEKMGGGSSLAGQKSA